MDELTTKFEVKTSRNDLPIPVINGIHLHSVYNPLKEAEAFVEKHASTIANNSNFLILGLGFGYHVEEILRQNPTKKISIIVIEPNQELVQAFYQNRNLPLNVEIKSFKKIDDYFFDFNFVQFLMKRPSIIKHDTSFNLERNFYTKLLSFHCPENFGSYRRILKPLWQDYLQDAPEEMSLSDMSTHLKRKPSLKNKEDFLVLCLQEIKNLNSEIKKES